VAREVEFLGQIEDPRLEPGAGVGVLGEEEDRLEVAQFLRDAEHLRRVEAGGVGEDGEAVAAVGDVTEDVDVEESHVRPDFRVDVGREDGGVSLRRRGVSLSV
jgi:hypothetical protein